MNAARAERKGRSEAGPQPADRSLLEFVRALAGREFTAASPALRKHLRMLLAAPGVCQDDLASVSLSAVRHDPRLKKLFAAGASASQGALKRKLLGPDAAKALDDPLLHTVLRNSIVMDLIWDPLLAGVRRSYLELALEAPQQISSPGHLRVLVSLACQCSNNEYVYFEEAAEKELLATLEKGTETSLRGDPPTWPPGTLAQLCCYAAYRSLGTLNCSASLAAYDWSSYEPALCDLIRAQILEPMEEMRLCKQIPSLGMSESQVTELVRRRYEESPYPRWLTLAIPERKSLAELLRANVSPTLQVAEPEGRLEILVAGCGTGRDAIHDAAEFRDAKVTAIDLSRTSLGYAARKAAEYGVSNLQFWHGDILALGPLNRRFHMVDSRGVLHHLEDTEAGLRVLAHLLHPGGFLRLALYSKIARRRFTAARKLVRKLNLTDAPDDVRRCRKGILAAPAGSKLAEVRDYSDFYMLSELRDLLFHPYQREFSLDEIAKMLKAQGLQFLGFERLSGKTREQFRRSFPQPGAMADLALWSRFERRHPRTFSSCYIFWARKPA